MVFIKSCSIDSRNDQSAKSEAVHQTKFGLQTSCPTHVWLALYLHWLSNLEVLNVGGRGGAVTIGPTRRTCVLQNVKAVLFEKLTDVVTHCY